MRSIFWSLEPFGNGSAGNGKQIPAALLTLSWLGVELVSLPEGNVADTTPASRPNSAQHLRIQRCSSRPFLEPGCGEVDTREVGCPAVPELHILGSSEVFRNEITWHLLIWFCGHGDIQLQAGFDDLGDLSQLQ